MEELILELAAPWQLLAAAAPNVLKGVGQALGIGKPKKEDYTPDTSYMDKYIANLRSRQGGREVYQQAMQPALRTIGQQGRKMQTQIGYDVARSGMGGSGIEAQQRLSAGKATLGAMQEASEKATAAQISENRRLGAEADRMTMQKEAAIAQGEQAFDRASSAFKQDVMGNIVSGVGAVAGAGIKRFAAGTEAFEKAKAAGLTTGTKEEFLKSAEKEGFSDPSKYAQHLSGVAEAKFGKSYLPPGVSEAMDKAGIPREQSSKIGMGLFNEELKNLRETLANEDYTDVEKEQELEDFIEDLKKRFSI